MSDSADGKIRWYSPDPRGILELDELKISRSLKQVLHKRQFEIRFDTAFERIINHCANREDTWISKDIVKSYCQMNDIGFAHSIETYRDNRLVGGLYGVAIKGAFFGESMFSLESNASKVALVALVQRLRERSYALLDIQMVTPILRQFGGKEISRTDYLEKLEKALSIDCMFI